MLESIPKEQRRHTHRLFQCLIVAIRPLRAVELTEIFAIQFDSKVGPNIVERWRPADPEEAVLTACSSLIAIVDVEDSRTVQFSHFSVKEFLTSDRLASSNVGNISRYYIPLEPAHTTLAQACLTELLELDDKTDKKRLRKFPLAFYAAQYWVNHAKFGNVISQIEDGMKDLFDPKKPHFAAWSWIHDLDGGYRSMDNLSEHPSPPVATPLYCAALYGFSRLAKHLITAHAEDVNAKCGHRGTPLHGAYHGGQLECMRLFLEHGADVDVRNGDNKTALHIASRNGQVEAVRLLLQHNADVNVKEDVPRTPKWTPLHYVSEYGYTEVAQLLLDHGADVNARSKGRNTPLYIASRDGRHGVVRLLLGRGADVHIRGDFYQTPFQVATEERHHHIAQLLLENGARRE
jgi:ankyrin repeat domain-containing protein 50